MNSAEQVLRQYKIPVTGQRIAILSQFLNDTKPLNQNLLGKGAIDTSSRYMVYRALRLFVEKGLLHVLPSEDGIVWYKLQLNSDAKPKHNHVHFLCRNCGKVFCLTDIPFPKIKVSPSFKTEATEVIMKGLCESCT